MTSTATDVENIVLISVCGALFFLYHLYVYSELTRRTRSLLALFRYFWFMLVAKPTLTTLRINMALRRQWVAKLHHGAGLEIMGVQTMHNLVLGSSLMATSVVSAITVFVGIAFTQDCGTSWKCVKIYVLTGVFTVAFLFFVWSVRAAVHTSVLIGLKPSDLEHAIAVQLGRTAAMKPHLPITKYCLALFTFNAYLFMPRGTQGEDKDDKGKSKVMDTVSEEGEKDEEGRIESRKERRRKRRREKRLANRLLLYSRVSSLAERFLDHYTIYFHLGTRCFYFAPPLLAWFLSPWAMLGVTLGILVVMYFHDNETAIFGPFYFIRIFY